MANLWDVTARAETPSATFEMCEFTWPSPNEVVVYGRAPTLSILSRSRRTPPGRSDGRYDDVANSNFQPLGDVIFQPEGTHFHSRGEGGQNRFLRIAFQPGEGREELDLSPDHTIPTVQKQLLFVRSPTIQFGLSRVLSEFMAPGMASAFLLDGLAKYLAVEVSRYAVGVTRTTDSFRGGLAPWQLRRISERIHDDVAAPPSVTEIADLVRLSARHVARAYRQSTGRALSEEIELVRQERAERLVLAGQHPLKEIAVQLGFSSQASFSTAFRRRAGCSPREFASRAG